MPWIRKNDTYKCDVCKLTFYTVTPSLMQTPAPPPGSPPPTPAFLTRTVHLGAASAGSGGRERTVCSTCKPGFAAKVLAGGGPHYRVEVFRDGDAKPTVISHLAHADVAGFVAGTAVDLDIASLLRAKQYKSPGGKDYKGHSAGPLGTRVTAPFEARPYVWKVQNPHNKWHSHVDSFPMNIRVAVNYYYYASSRTLQIFISDES